MEKEYEKRDYNQEALSSVNRTLNFRLTVRDNVVGQGQTNFDDVVVTVANKTALNVADEATEQMNIVMSVIAIIAIIFLGPEKLPEAMVKGAKFFKSFKNSINDVKSSFEQEMKIQELKEEALTYKKKLDEATSSARKVITFDELEEIKKTTQGVNDSFKELENSVKESASLEAPKTVTTPETIQVQAVEKPKETKKEENV